MQSTKRRRWWSQPAAEPVKNILLAAAYFIVAKFGLALSFSTEQISAIWPATGLAIAALLLGGVRFWPGIFLGALLANITAKEPVSVALTIAVGNTLEAVVARILLVHVMDFRHDMGRLRDVLALIPAVVGGAWISATLGATSLLLSDIIRPNDWLFAWLTWWAGDTMGGLIIVPAVAIWWPRDSWAILRVRRRESALFLLVVTASSLLLFLTPPNNTAAVSLKYLFFPLLIWITFRLRIVGAMTAALIIMVIAIWAALHGLGPFALEVTPETNLILLQAFVLALAFTSMIISSILSQRESEHGRAEALLVNMGEGIIATDDHGKITLVNPVASAMLGVGSRELLGRQFSQAITAFTNTGQVISAEERTITAVLRHGQVVHADRIWQRANGDLMPVTISNAPIQAGGSIIGCVIVFRDQTEAKRMDRAKSEFLSLASHQLRTPLTTLRWYVELLQHDQQSLSATNREYIADIQRATMSMITLVNSLLNVTRLELGQLLVQPRLLQLSAVLTDIVYQSRTQIELKGLTVRQTSDRDIPAVTVDRQLISIIIENILSNAIKYTPVGGRIDIHTAAHEDYIELSVRDTGYGIPLKDQPQIFSRMFRAGNVRRLDPNGTGIGLFLAKSIANETGCDLRFESTEGQGTTFFLRIPSEGMKAQAGPAALSRSFT